MAKLSPSFDVSTATASDVAALLSSGSITSEQVVETYLSQIEKHNKSGLNLRAIISVSPTANEQAALLDQERRSGSLRGPLHGLPVILKDCIQTSSELGMPTTGGAAVFKSAFARSDAEVVRRLRDKGLVILGKASLTEYCGCKAKETTAGWNAVNGQTQSVWVEGGVREGDLYYGRSTPGGSSSGSGVGVAAGFAPLSVATETGGSCCLPANRSGLYSVKLTHEPELLKGVLPLCLGHDGLGAMARSARDVELLVRDMAGSRQVEVKNVDWKDIRIGFIDAPTFGVVPKDEEKRDESHNQILTEYQQAIDKIRGLGAKVVYPAELVTMGDLSPEGKSVLHNESFIDIPAAWPGWIANMDGAPVKTFKDIVDWNEAHPELGMPEPHTNQQDLLDVLNATITPEELDKMRIPITAKAKQGIEDCLKVNEVDIIVGPGDCGICVVASIARCPSAMVPYSILNGEKGMGQPQGLMIITKPHDEGKMLEFMKLWEKEIGPWKAPTRLKTLK